MRTTLQIDDDILEASKAIADLQHKSLGEVISMLARQALTPARSNRQYRNGVPLLEVQPNAGRASQELVNRLRDELP